MRKHYNTYAEIPPLAERKHIMSIPLSEINSFLDGLHDYYKTKQEEYSEGWVD